MFRPQTYYLIICLITTMVLPFVFPLWKDAAGKPFYFMADMVYVVLLGLSNTLTLLSLFSHKKQLKYGAMEEADLRFRQRRRADLLD